MPNLCCNASIPKNPSQSRQLTVLTMPDRALRPTYVTSQNRDYKMFKMR